MALALSGSHIQTFASFIFVIASRASPIGSQPGLPESLGPWFPSLYASTWPGPMRQPHHQTTSLAFVLDFSCNSFIIISSSQNGLPRQLLLASLPECFPPLGFPTPHTWQHPSQQSSCTHILQPSMQVSHGVSDAHSSHDAPASSQSIFIYNAPLPISLGPRLPAHKLEGRIAIVFAPFDAGNPPNNHPSDNHPIHG